MATTTALAQPVRDKGNVATMLATLKPHLKQAMPRYLDIERFIKVCLTDIVHSPKLLGCTRESLMNSIMEAAKLGLEPGVAQQCHIVPYGNKAQLIPGYRGLLKLARQSGGVGAVQVDAVYSGDEFDYAKGTDPHLKHKPKLEGDRPDKDITHVYAVIHLSTSDDYQFDVMTKAQVDGIRAKSPAGSSGPWVTHYAEMAKKTVLRRAMKLCPMSVEAERAVTLDEYAEIGKAQPIDAAFLDADPVPATEGMAEELEEDNPKPRKRRTKSKDAGDSGSTEALATPESDRRAELLARVMQHAAGTGKDFTKEIRRNFGLQSGKLLAEDFADYKDSDLLDLLAELEMRVDEAHK